MPPELFRRFEDATGVRSLRIRTEEKRTLDGWELEIADSGGGLPEGIDPNTPVTGGLELVKHYCDSVNATISVSRQGGTAYLIDIPKPVPDYSAW